MKSEFYEQTMSIEYFYEIFNNIPEAFENELNYLTSTEKEKYLSEIGIRGKKLSEKYNADISEIMSLKWNGKEMQNDIFRMNDICGAVAFYHYKNFENYIEDYRKIFIQIYGSVKNLFEGIVKSEFKSINPLKFPLLIDNSNKLRSFFCIKGIEISNYNWPRPVYRILNKNDDLKIYLKNCEYICENILLIPLHHMIRKDIDAILEIINYNINDL